MQLVDYNYLTVLDVVDNPTKMTNLSSDGDDVLLDRRQVLDTGKRPFDTLQDDGSLTLNISYIPECVREAGG